MNRVFSHRRSVYVIVMSAVAAAMVAGCKPHTRDNPDVCLPGDESPDPCAKGFVCNESYRCVGIGGNGGAGGTGDTIGTGGTIAAGGAGGQSLGGQPAAGGGKVGSGGVAAGGAVSTGGAGGRGGAAAGGKAGGAGGAGGAPPECSDTKACQDPAKLCLAGVCVACKDDSNCKDTKPICSPQHVCVACNDPDAKATACSSHTKMPVCLTSTQFAGACVECEKHTDCKGQKPVCANNICVACDTDAACSTATNKALPICMMTGASPGACVECGKDADCSVDPNKPFCSATGTCKGCDPLDKEACKTRVPGKPVCAAAGACVQCVMNLECDSKAPVCSSGNTCGPCSVDGDCAGRYGPTICMTKDGHCAVEAETIYVQNVTGCSDTGAGTAMAPHCSLQNVPAAIAPTRNLVVIRGAVSDSPTAFGTGAQQQWIVGQMSAVITGPNTGIHLTSGELTVRDVSVSRTLSVGIQADAGSTVYLQRVTVGDNPKGGILLDGASFDIQGTTVKNNGPGDMAGTAWGGIRIFNPPGSGPKQLTNVTVQANNGGGISCSAAVSGTGVLALDNTNSPNQISPTCMIMSCAAPSQTCGAQ